MNTIAFILNPTVSPQATCDLRELVGCERFDSDARSLTYNFGPRWVPLVLEEYGLPVPDEEKLKFYQLLDEFF